MMDPCYVYTGLDKEKSAFRRLIINLSALSWRSSGKHIANIVQVCNNRAEQKGGGSFTDDISPQTNKSALCTALHFRKQYTFNC